MEEGWRVLGVGVEGRATNRMFNHPPTVYLTTQEWSVTLPNDGVFPSSILYGWAGNPAV